MSIYYIIKNEYKIKISTYYIIKNEYKIKMITSGGYKPTSQNNTDMMCEKIMSGYYDKSTQCSNCNCQHNYHSDKMTQIKLIIWLIMCVMVMLAIDTKTWDYNLKNYCTFKFDEKFFLLNLLE